jgi:hypothetical protein
MSYGLFLAALFIASQRSSRRHSSSYSYHSQRDYPWCATYLLTSHERQLCYQAQRYYDEMECDADARLAKVLSNRYNRCDDARVLLVEYKSRRWWHRNANWWMSFDEWVDELFTLWARAGGL